VFHRRRALVHPAERIRGVKAGYLKGKCVLLGLTGSVAAYKAIDTARWLIRRGAKVRFVVTKPALKLVGKDLLYWATGERPITNLTGEVEHISIAEECNSMAVAPATLSTLAKIASGVVDNPVAALAVSVTGMGKPLVVVPAMHANLMENRAIWRGDYKII